MIGFDVGTYNLVCAKRGENGEIKNKREVNAFLEIPLDNRFTFNMMKKANVPIIEREKVAYVVGESAVNLAYTLRLDLKRPMKDGCLNPQERDAFRILNIMIHSLIGEVSRDKEVLYYTVPAPDINGIIDVDYHQKILEEVFKRYKVKDKTIQAYPINEALAVIFAELGHKNYTGIGVSTGAGAVNVCYAILSQPVFAFSSVNSGDWIDEMAGKAVGEPPAVINKEKMKIDLTKTPNGIVERAIHSQYRIMIDKTIQNIKKSVTEAGNKVRAQEPLDIVIAGGTSSPNGFVELFKQGMEEVGMPFPIGEVTKPEDNLFTVAKGAALAAENA